MMWVITLIAVAIAAARVAGIVHPSYQAGAHLFVGGLFGAWLVKRNSWEDRTSWLNLVLAVGLTVVEVACFLWFRFVS